MSALATTHEKVTPPISHKIHPSKLQIGDHIYRRLKGINKYFAYHHGVVTSITNHTQNNLKQNEINPQSDEDEKPYWSYLASSMIEDTNDDNIDPNDGSFCCTLHKQGIHGKWSNTPYTCVIDADSNFFICNSTHFKQILHQTYLPLKDCMVDINYKCKEIQLTYLKPNDQTFSFSFRYPSALDSNNWTTCVHILLEQSGSSKQHLLTHIKVIEMTRAHGIREISLSTFLDGDDCRLVYYDTYKMYERIHAAGTCHFEPSSSISEVLKRVEMSRLCFSNDHDLYDLFSTNCEEFAIWLKTGMYNGTRMSQLQAAVNKKENVIHCVGDGVKSAGATAVNIARQIFKYSATATDDVTTATVIKAGLQKGNMATAVGVDVAENVPIKAITGTGAAAAIGIAVVVEVGCTAHKVYKYKTDYKYTKCDLYRDVGRGWTTTAVTTGAGIGFVALGFGWSVILPIIGIGLFVNWVLQHWKVWDKTLKEKLYKEHKLNKKSSTLQMKKVRRRIRRQIRDEKLHPDHWEIDLSETEKKKNMDKFLWLQQMLEFLNEDIARGCVTFHEEKEIKKQDAIALNNDVHTV